MKLYRIKNWEANFEKSDNRKAKSMPWVATPTKHDGLSFRRTMAQEDGLALFGAWNLILQIAAKTQPRERRGYLERDGIPMTSEDVALSTGACKKAIERALTFFSSKSIDWIEVVNAEDKESYETKKEISRQHPDAIPTKNGLQDNTIQDKTRQSGRDGIVDILNGLTDARTFNGITKEKFIQDCKTKGVPEEKAHDAFAFLQQNKWRTKDGRRIKNMEKYINGIARNHRKESYANT